MGAKVIFFLISKFQQGLTYSALAQVDPAPLAPTERKLRGWDLSCISLLKADQRVGF